jgi:hypothetical protein
MSVKELLPWLPQYTESRRKKQYMNIFPFTEITFSGKMEIIFCEAHTAQICH